MSTIRLTKCFAPIGLLLCLLLCAATALAEGLSPHEALKQFKVADGFELQLFASEPEIRQPVAMQFDRRGRLWVIQYLQYPNPAGLKAVSVDNFMRTVWDRVPEPPPKGPRGVDRITILEDADGDGRADSAKDFLQGLNLTTGFALGHGGAFVLQSPYLLFYADRDEDDVPDGDPEVLLSGFGMEDSHAMANSLQWGPDGWLYGAQGSTVTAQIRGLTFQQGIWRYHPLTKKFELFAEGGGNTWGVDFDRHGNLMAGTNFGGSAMLHQVQGGYYIKNFGKHGALQNPYAFGFFGHLPYPGFKGGHVTCGGIVYRGGSFPQQFNDQYIAANLLSNAIYWHYLEPAGSSFANRFGGELLTTGDQRFRPVDCAVGPDGSLFVADWYDQRANHVDPKDDWDKTTGRIYKLKAAGTPPVAGLDLRRSTTAELIALLDHKNDWFSHAARLMLAERRDPQAVAPLLAHVRDASQPQRSLEAFWALYVSGGFNDELALEFLSHRLADVRAWTVRLLGDERCATDRLLSAMIELAKSDESPAVRNQLACTAKRLPARQSLPLVSKLLKRTEDRSDPQIPLLLWWAIEDKAASDHDAVLNLFASSDFWQLPLVKEQLVERLARRYAAVGGEDDFSACARLLALAPAAGDALLVVRGMEKGLAGRKLDKFPESLERPLADLQRQRAASGAIDRDLLLLTMRLGGGEAFRRAGELISNTGASAADRMAVLAVLGEIGPPELAAKIVAVLDEPRQPALHKAAMAALARSSDPTVADAILARYPQMTAELRTAAEGLLCSRKPWAAALLAEVDQGRIPPAELSPDQLRQIALHNDRELNALIEKHWGKVEQSTPGEKLARIHGIKVSLKLASGDPRSGHELFKKHCATCHSMFGEGNKVGPDLTGAERKNLDFLLSNIVDPSAVIRKEYVSFTVSLADGRILTGLIAESTPQTVTLLDAKNQRLVIPQSDIDEMVRSPLSLMPEKILDQLDAQQVRDLFSYLGSDGKR